MYFAIKNKNFNLDSLLDENGYIRDTPFLRKLAYQVKDYYFIGNETCLKLIDSNQLDWNELNQE